MRSYWYGSEKYLSIGLTNYRQPDVCTWCLTLSLGRFIIGFTIGRATK